MKKKKFNLPLLEVIVISLVLHLAGLFILGGITLWEMMSVPEPEFEAPMVAQDTTPPREMQVRLNQAQQQSTQPTRVLQVTNVSQMNLPSLDIDLPTVNTRVAVSGAGAGAGGFGRSFGTGGIDLSRSAVNFFGIRSSGENIVFILDVSRTMLERERGDVWGFNRVKEEIGKMIDELKPGTLFNVYAFERGLDVFSAAPLAATQENKENAKKWINEYWRFQGSNIVGRQGTTLNNYKPTYTESMPIRRHRLHSEGEGVDISFSLVPRPEDTTGSGQGRLDMALLAAFENAADTIFVITDGVPDVYREYEQRGVSQHERDVRNWEREKARLERSGAWARYEAEREDYRKKVAAYQEDRRKRGLPPEIRRHTHGIGGIPVPRPPQGHRPVYNPRIRFDELNAMLRGRARDLYRERGGNPPPVHIVGYSVTDRTEDGLKTLQRGFANSRFRSITSDDLKVPEAKGSS